jgi:hypothetical protein
MTTKPVIPFTHQLLLRILIIGISAVLYSIACIVPALAFVNNNYADSYQTWSGFDLLAIGWMGVLIGQLGWYANPLLWLGVVALLLRRLYIAMALVCLSLCLALNTFFLYLQPVPADAASTNRLLFQHPQVGFFLWIGSILVIGAGAVFLWVLERNRAGR